MTENNDKLRSLFLTALMVMSLFAMTVAFSGAASAQAANVGIDKATEYTDGEDNEVELVFDEQLAEPIEGDDVTALVDGENLGTGTGTVEDGNSSDPRAVISIDEDATPNQNLTIIVDNRADEDGDTDGTIVAQDITVTASGIDSESAGDQGNVYQGEVIGLQASTDSTVTIEGSGGGVEAEDSLGPNSGVYTYDTEDLDTGSTYNATSNNAGGDDAQFSVSDLGLNIEDHTADAYTQDNITADVSVTRGGEGATGVLSYEDDDDFTNRTVVESLSSNDDTEFDFGQLGEDAETGEYMIEITDNQTGVTVNETVNVSDAPDADIAFSDNVIQEERGDTATIELEFSDNEDEATLVMGNQEDFGYLLQANVTADSEGDTVVLEFDSSAADDDPLSVGEDEDADVDDQNTFGASETLDSAEYDMNVSASHWSNINSSSREVSDVGTLSLQDRSTDAITTMVSSSAVDDEEVWNDIGTNVTESDEVAYGGVTDYAVFQIEASGLEGTMPDTASAPGEGLFDDSSGVFFEATHEDPGPNQEADHLTLGPDNVTLHNDAANDTYFVSVDLDAVPNATDGHEYQSNFTVRENGLADDNEVVLSNWSTVDSDAELDTGNGNVTVSPSDNQTVNGSTNIAPGTDVTLFMQATESDTPFLVTPTATVQPDGTFEASTDEFSDRAVGAEFDAQVRVNNQVLGDTYDGVIQEPATPTPTPNATTEPPAETTEPGMDTTEPGMDTTEPDSPTPTEGDGPGFGIAVSLIALIGAALLAARRFN